MFESEAEKCFRLILEIRTSDNEPGKITEFEKRQIRGYASQYGAKTFQAIEKLALIGWRCTPDQIIRVIQGKLNPETVYDKTNNKATMMPSKKYIAPTSHQRSQETHSMPDDVKEALKSFGRRPGKADETPKPQKSTSASTLTPTETEELTRAQEEARRRIK